MPTLPRRLYWLVFHADAHFDLAFRRIRRTLGIARPLRVVPYRGYGTARRACIKARVQEDRGAPPTSARRSLLGTAMASYKRYATVEIPRAELRIEWGDRAWNARTDDEGFMDLWVEPPPGARPGWNQVSLEVLSPRDGTPPAKTTAPVLIIDRDAELGIISDIDDTVIVTGVTNPLKRAYALFLTDHRTRLPFEGVSEFYLALHEGRAAAPGNPVFYVSSSPWNLYEHLDHFMIINEIPPGPILLRDWGLTRTGFAPGGGHGHKLDKIREVLDALPELPFVLIGDSGQEDAEHYRTIVREQGDRILAVYIRVAHRRVGRDDELSRIAREVRELGSEMIIVDDTVAAAQHAAQRGFIRWEEIGLIEERKRQDVEGTTLMDEILDGVEEGS